MFFRLFDFYFFVNYVPYCCETPLQSHYFEIVSQLHYCADGGSVASYLYVQFVRDLYVFCSSLKFHVWVFRLIYIQDLHLIPREVASYQLAFQGISQSVESNKCHHPIRMLSLNPHELHVRYGQFYAHSLRRHGVHRS